MNLQSAIQHSYETVLQYAHHTRLILLHPHSRYRSLVVAKLLADQPYPVFYYAMGLYDVDLDSFLSGFIHDLSEQSASFGSQSGLFLHSVANHPRPKVLAALADDLSHLSDDPFLLILDEYDASESADDVQSFLEELLAYLPPHCYVIINSRHLPRLPWLAMIARHEALILDDTHLVLDDPYRHVDSTYADQIQINCLGPGEIIKEAHVIQDWEGHLPRLLLIFALERPVVTRSEICRAFWPNLDTDQAVNVFHVTKRRLHKALGFDALVHENGYYQVNPKIWTTYDVNQFVSALLRGRMSQGDESAQAWQEAIELYKGPFLQGYEDDWVLKQRNAYQLGYLEAVMALAQWRMEAGRSDHAIRMLITAGQENLRYEPIHQTIMRLYTSLGRRSEAASHYQSWVARLKHEGAAPSQATQTLYAELMS
jgi:DNA-binding SARP family transcriptional activator